MAFLDRGRAASLMESAGLDALVLLTPESFAYATGAPAGPAAMWRRAGAFAAIVPADPAVAEAAVVTDLFAASFAKASHITDISLQQLWVETSDLRGIEGEDAAARIAAAWSAKGRTAGFARPETFDRSKGFALIADLLAVRGLASARIGVELADVSAADVIALAAALPDAKLRDATDIMRRLKAIKTPAEIGYLRTACELAEAGTIRLRDRAALGMSRAELAEMWKQGVTEAAGQRGVANLTGSWEFISVGDDLWTPGGMAVPGAIMRVDVGCLIAGYTSDSARTFVFGEPDKAAADIHAALHAAFEAGMAALKPGALLSDVHAAATRAMHEAGFAGYSRGHFGHGLGASLGSEEWPFISAGAHLEIEPGMVLAFETPWYVDGLGGFIIENQVLVTEESVEVMNTLPTELVRVG